MTIDVSEKRARFRDLHREGLFALPNPWDLGSLRRLEAMGWRAVATTSSGLAWSLGRADGELSRDDVLAHLETMCAATDLPVNADFENGYAEDLGGLADNVRAAVATGVCGLSIEDQKGGRLYEVSEAVERLAAARAALDGAGADVVLWNTDAPRAIANADLHHDCAYTPYEGIEVPAWPEVVISRGEVVAERGALLGAAGRGLFLPCERPAPARPKTMRRRSFGFRAE